MKKIANVDGTNVYSDKPGSISIDGSHIAFADGSSCDVRTKAVSNRGPGGIQIGEGDGSEVGQEKVTKGPMPFSTTDLRLSNFTANIVIGVWNRSDMELALSGPKDALEAIIAKRDGSTLCIEGKNSDASSGGVSVSRVSIRSGRGSSSVSIGNLTGGIVIAGGSVTVIGNANVSSTDAITVSVKVPRGAAITLNGTEGGATIGDVDGTLNVNTKGGGEIRSGRMREATIAILGSTDVHISEVNGPLTTQIMGSGEVRVKSGAVTALTVRIMGSGDFCFGGVADTATLSVMGTGDIKVAKVKTKPVKQCMGTGEITVS